MGSAGQWPQSEILYYNPEGKRRDEGESGGVVLVRVGSAGHSPDPKRCLSMQPESSPAQELIEKVTSVLKDDEELRQDVSHELNTHFEDSQAAFLEEGKSKEESETLALKAFGDPKQIAKQLAHSNQGRMKTRALVRMFLGRILVPLSVVLVMWMVNT